MDTSNHLNLLTEAGLRAVAIGPNELRLSDDNWRRSARVLARTRIPAPENIRRDLQSLHSSDLLLYLLPRTNPTIRAIARSNPHLALVGLADRTIVLDGRVMGLGTEEPAAAPTVRRRPWGRFATARELIRRHGHTTSQHRLADTIGISQPAVSNALRALQQRDLLPIEANVKDGKHSLRALIDYAITEYPGPAGITTHWFALDDPARAAHKLHDAITNAGALVGGDLAADRYAPWKRTTRLALYSPTGIDLAAFGLAEASSEESNVVLRVPGDATIFATAKAWPKDDADRFTDPLITAWELTQSPDSDADQAVEHLKRYLEKAAPSF